MINAGRLDRKIKFERDAGATQDALGAVTENWEKLKEVWAAVVPISGQEVFRSGKETGLRVARFTVRFFTGLTEKDRISYDGETWDILHLRELGRKEGLEILAQVNR